MTEDRIACFGGKGDLCANHNLWCLECVSLKNAVYVSGYKMSQFEPAVEKILILEGGLVDDASRDLGGITNFGISLRFLRSINSQAVVDDIRALTREEAIQLYQQYFWEASNIEEINNQPLADKLFDLVVNMGQRNAIVLLQIALEMPDAEQDGVLGPLTIMGTNEANPYILLRFLRLEAIRYYYKLAQAQPSQRGLLRGWVGRCLA